jgi:3'(2'), 5'-bisphosphate nucleotidase
MTRGLKTLMRSLDHSQLADALLAAVLSAGNAILHHRRAGVAVETKSDASPLTAADREAEAIIMDALATAEPGVPVVAEEAASAGALPDIGTAFFLVDPLDGTREFIAGRHEFTVNIGLVIDRAPQFGMIYAPALGRLFATTGSARAVEAVVPAAASVSGLAALTLEPIRTREPDPERLTAVASRSHRSRALEDFLMKWPVSEHKSIGSSLKFCLVARGEADLYPRLGTTSEWDTAAGHAIVTAAGGTVTMLDGTPLTYGRANASYRNPDFVAWGRRSMLSLL